MARDNVTLIVNGFAYEGFKSGTVTRSIESLAGSFSVDVSDRWDGKAKPWPIRNEDACRVEIGGETVIDGYIDRTKISASATTRALGYSGKDRAAALVECALLVEGASVNDHKWSYRNLDVAQFAAEIAAPHGIRVRVQPGLVLQKDPLLVAHPGEKGFEAIKRAAASAGVLVVSDGAGGILVTRAGTGRAEALIEGFNILSAEFDSDATNRFRRYLISSQIPGADDASGEATSVQAEATDRDVRRASRVDLIRPDKGYSNADAKRRADWEARIRAALADSVTVTVQGWRQRGGELWPLNALVLVSATTMIGVRGDMLISQVEYSIGDGGQVTQLHLVRPDAFEPEPQAVVSGEGGWKELAKGV